MINSPEKRGDFLSQISGIGDTAAKLIGAIKGTSGPSNSTAQRTLEDSGTRLPAWLMPVALVVGGVLLVLVVVKMLRQ